MPPRARSAAARSPSAASTLDGLPILSFADAKAFGDWLAENHRDPTGAWLRMARKGTTETLITYQAALDVALCWGWIDGQKKSLDERAFLQRFTPRRARSIWSDVNRKKVLALIESGAMQPPGLAEVERARGDGRWDAAYSSASRSVVPADLTAALAEKTGAAAFFASLSAQNRYAILFRLQTATKPETRARRLAEFVAMCERGDTVHPVAAKKKS